VVLSIDLLFDLSENTWILLSGKDSRNSRKSVAAFAFDCPCETWILLQASAQVLVMTHRGICNRLIYSIRRKENKRYTKCILSFFIYKNCVLQIIKR